MEQKGSITQWRLSLAESLALASTVAIVTLWAMSEFQSKDDAREWKVSVENRIHKVESEISNIKNSVDGIGKDVSYIRGRLEPQVSK